MQARRITPGWRLLVIAVLVYSGLPQATSAKKKPVDDVAVQGCVQKTSGQFVLVQNDPATTYKLESGHRKIKLDRYLGQQVEVAGWESPSLSTSSEHLSRTTASSLTLMVTSIKAISKQCTH